MTSFDAARRQALMSDLLRQLGGRPTELLAFGEVRERLGLTHLVDRGVAEIPIERIVGSVGRPREFTRAFLPRSEASRERWRRVEALARGPSGFEPIDVYKVGELYFVVDGHHRVSVARSVGAPTIEARVKEFRTPIAIDPDESLDELLLRRAYNEFLAVTGLEPEAADEFLATTADAYERLLEHISVHRYYRGIEDNREVGWDEAVHSWRDHVYRPMIATIHASNVMEEFPQRTETDLYLFTMDHLHRLRERYGERPVGIETAVRHFRYFAAPRGKPRSWLARVWRWLGARLRGRGRSVQRPGGGSSGGVGG